MAGNKTEYQPEWCHNFECDYPKCNCLEPPVYSNATDAIGFQEDMQRRKKWETVKGIQDLQIEISNLRRENEALKEQRKLLYDYLHEMSKQIQVKLALLDM